MDKNGALNMYASYYNLECTNCGFREENIKLWKEELDYLWCPKCKEKWYITRELVHYESEED